MITEGLAITKYKIYLHDKFENRQKSLFPRKCNLPKHTEEIENLKRCLMIKDAQSTCKNLYFSNNKKQ